MVDINLFEDEEKEEKAQPQDLSSKGKEEKPSSSLFSEEDFGFEEELSGSDLEQLGPDMFEEETPSGALAKKKASPQRKGQKSVSWSFIVVMALIAGGFLVFLQYGMKRFAYSQPKQSPSKPVKPSLPGPVTTRPVIGAKKDSVQGVPPGGVKIASGAYLDATKAIVENLCKNGQFAGVLLKENQFYVEYVSFKGFLRPLGNRSRVGWALQNLRRLQKKGKEWPLGCVILESFLENFNPAFQASLLELLNQAVWINLLKKSMPC